MNRKAKAAGIGVGLILAKRIKESEMYAWATVPSNKHTGMREKMLKHLDHLIEEIRNDY